MSWLLLYKIIRLVVKQGEIYFDPQFEYPAGNREDKFLIILNKSYLPSQPIIAVPVTTDKKDKYKKGCNHRSYLFRIESKSDYFNENTLVQLFITNNPLDETVFLDKKTNHGLVFVTSLSKNTIDEIMKCLKQLKDDIDSYLHQYLF